VAASDRITAISGLRAEALAQIIQTGTNKEAPGCV
jgi:hypothetical protein